MTSARRHAFTIIELLSVFNTILMTLMDRAVQFIHLLAPPLAIGAFARTQAGMSEHVRYVLPVLTFCYIWTGRLGPAFHATCAGMVSWMQNAVAPAGFALCHICDAGIAALSLARAASKSLLSVPHSLAYFNDCAGGRHNGWRYLVSTNTDWDQDRIYLERLIDSHPDATGVALAYYGGLEQQGLGVPSRATQREDAGSLLASPNWTNRPDSPRHAWAHYAFGSAPAAGHATAVVRATLIARLKSETPFASVGDAKVVYRALLHVAPTPELTSASSNGSGSIFAERGAPMNGDAVESERCLNLLSPAYALRARQLTLIKSLLDPASIQSDYNLDFSDTMASPVGAYSSTTMWIHKTFHRR